MPIPSETGIDILGNVEALKDVPLFPADLSWRMAAICTLKITFCEYYKRLDRAGFIG